ncbi:MAG: HYR domain-containing protein [Saprospiraceae bacterium]|nr:HYR domain-containing protein [Saprospiraceae bacterium]
MKFKSAQHFVVVSIVAILFLSFSSSHPVGRTGAPGDGLCSDCHGGSGGGFDGDVTMSGVPTNAEPGVTYTVTVDVDVSVGSPIRGGFQILALKDANDTQAGTWSNNDGNSSIKQGSSGRFYFGHMPAQNFGGGSNLSWEADWEAPAINDDVTFYMVANLANGSGSSGDKIITNQFTTTIVVVDPLEVDFSNIMGVTCNGDSDGSATATVSGGNPPYTIDWASGESGTMANSLAGGSQGVTITDNDDTVIIENITIPEPDEIDADPDILDIDCFGNENGAVNINPFGGTGTLTCEWSFDEGCEQEDLEGGTYFVTITDEQDCSTVVEIEVFEPDELILNMSSTDANAGNDGTATCRPSGGTSPYDFAWSNGVIDNGTMSSIDNLVPGDYEVTVTDENGCQEVNTVNVGGLACNISAVAEVNDVLCYGESSGSIVLNVSGVSTGVSYLWSNGFTTSSIFDIPIGTYSVTITESPSCVETLSGLVVSEPDTLQAALTFLVNPTCSNSNDGGINLGIAGGVPGYDLMWSNGLTNDTLIMGMDTVINLPDTLTQLGVGTYAYTLSDSNGCTIVDSVILNNADVMPPVILLRQFAVLLDDNGMAPPIDFSDVDAGTFDNCELGEIDFDTGPLSCVDIGIQGFTVVVYDTNGNSSEAIASVVIEDVTPPEINCLSSNIVVSTCGPVNYVIPIATDNCDIPVVSLVDGLASGEDFPVGTTEITYEAIDACGNAAECSFNVTVNNNLDVEATVVDASCSEANGSIELDISGGTPPYTVNPSNLTGLAAGNYELDIMDDSGCSTTITVSVGQSDNNLSGIISTTEPICHGENSGSVSVNVMGGSGDYSFEYASGVNPDALSAGEYEVVITDNIEGCQITESFEINEPEELMIAFNNVDVVPCTGELVNFDYSVTGGTAPYSESIEVVGSEVTLVISDDNGCAVSSSFMQMLIDLPLAITDVVVTDADDAVLGSINVNIEGGVAPYSYVWNDENGSAVGDTEDLDGLTPGEYTLIITDANGCVVMATYTVDMVSGIEDLNEDIKINVFPNPSSSVVNFKFEKKIPKAFTIFNANGARILKSDNLTAKSEVDVAQFSNGLYLVKFEFEDFVVLKTFFKI